MKSGYIYNGSQNIHKGTLTIKNLKSINSSCYECIVIKSQYSMYYIGINANTCNSTSDKLLFKLRKEEIINITNLSIVNQALLSTE